jgi:type VI secretion system secreted protein VgrG
MPNLEATQANRQIAVTSPLGDDVLLFHSMNVSEQLGRLFQFDLDLLSTDPEIKLQDILAQNVTIRYLRPDGENRYFNGFVNQFSQAGSHGNLFVYRATLRPWFWFLTRTADCRIFQNKKVPDIIKEVFRDKGFSDFEDALSGTYREWENCVQYRETDFNFISRLMEQEGMYYFFKHEDGKHTLVLSDSISAHETVPGYEEVPYYPPEESERRERDHISDWSLNQTIQPGVYALNDFDFKKPRANLEVKSSIIREHDQAELEIYDYPGEYRETSDGDAYVRARIEELQAQYEEVQGQGNVAGLMTGCLFKLINYPREDQNREYLIISSSYSLGPQEYESAFAGGNGSIFSCGITAIDKQQAYRAPRITPKPIVQGPQTAIVVGKAGEEIWTDQYGRVKVQFHWDRYGEDNENSSCWVRVSQPWAGKNWGAVAIPRMGQEVIVSFREGDPDQPIITGRVYNEDNMPPYELPANATQSGVKSRSSKGGAPDNFNELRFEDKKGSEEVYIHAEKDQNNVVENNESTSVGNDRSETVGNDETISIGNNRTEDVGNDETITIGNNRTETVGTDETITIGSNRTESVGADETVTIGSNRSVTIGSSKTETISINKAETIGVAKELTIGGAYQVTVGAAMNETIGAAKAEEIGAVKSVNVGANSSENVGANKSVDAGGNISESAGKDVNVSSGKKMSLTAGDDFAISGSKKGVISIADELSITCGKASIVMKKNGDITINGKAITIKGSGDVIIKGKKILQN